MKTTHTAVVNGLSALKQKDPPQKNSISAYLPYRNKGADFDLDYVTGALVGVSKGVKLSSNFELETLRKNSLKAIENKADDTDLTECIDNIYFASDATNLKQLSPLFKLLCASKNRKQISPGSRHLEQILGRFLDVGKDGDKDLQNYNIFEGIIVEEFRNELKQLKDIESKANEPEAYLPFISELFAKDFDFLSDHPTYFVEQARSFLGLYAFLYCSQLALNITDWEEGQPRVKPLYFILDTEKCSMERRAATSYKDLARSVSGVFPTLTMLEVLNEEIDKADGARLPLWKIFEHLKDASDDDLRIVCNAIDNYADRFIAEEKPGRNLKARDEMSSDSLKDKLRILFTYAMDQFDPQRCKGGHLEAMKKRYMAPFEKEVAEHFAQTRGRLGKILVMNQDYLLLLTNLAIGNRESVRLQDLLAEFAKRGAYFDKQSELKLINFFERIGNIERMSDSGDAVYVKPTV